MKNFALALTCMLVLTNCQAQPQLEKVEAALKMNNDVSAVLTDTNYMSLHPETSFRELIKKYTRLNSVRITPGSEPGKKIRVLVRVLDDKGKPVKDVAVYFYQTDARGWYAADKPHVGGNEGDMLHARLFGYAISGNDGLVEIFTVKPSGYPNSDLPAHIHIHFAKNGVESLVTELLFDDDPRLVGEIRQRALEDHFPIAKPDKGQIGFEQQFYYSINLK